jgi:hypothetical protein
LDWCDSLSSAIFVDHFLHPPRAKICHGNDTTYNNPKLFAGRRVYQMLLSGRSTLPYAADKREKSNPDCGCNEEGNKFGPGLLVSAANPKRNGKRNNQTGGGVHPNA